MTDTLDDLLGAVRSFLQERRVPPLQAFMADIDWAMERRSLAARGLPCLAALPAAERAAVPATAPLVCRLAGLAADRLAWGQTYGAGDFGDRFLANYGWMELFGSRGHFVNDRVAAGFLLLGPQTHYPDHRHVAEEIYFPLTSGTEWRMGDAPFASRAAGEAIHHASGVPHAMRTGRMPLLALYLWRGGPLDQRSELGVAAGERG